MKSVSKIKGIVITFVVLSAIVAGILFSYPFILNNYQGIINEAKAEEERIRQDTRNGLKEEFINVLYRSNYSLYADIAQENKGETMMPSEIFLPNYGKNTGKNRGNSTYDEVTDNIDEDINNVYDDTNNINEEEITIEIPEDGLVDNSYQIVLDDEEIENNIYNFNNLLNAWRSVFYRSDINEYELEYYIVDDQTKNYLTNTIKPLVNLKNNGDLAKELQKSYSFYAVFQYDANGDLQIPVFSGLDQDKKDLFITLDLTKQVIRQESDTNNWYQYGNQIKGPSNVTIIYAAKSDDFYYGHGNYMYYSGELDAFENGGFIHVFLIAIVVIALVSIVISVRKNSTVRNLAGLIPGEISIFGALLPFMVYTGLLSMAKETASGSFMDFSNLLLPDNTERVLDYVFNYFTWMVVLGVSLMCMISLLQVFNLGLRRYIKERTIFGWCYVKLKEFLKSLKDIDLTDSSNKAIIKILAVNFVVLSILCTIWVAGIFVLIIYSIVLFFILKKYVTNLKLQYQVLMNATSKMAEGNLEVVEDKDLGLFNPLKEELSKVQNGFKTAVEEEMKSQKMKTELISNVSHDLKTPLTAIITYVNLLKDENITEEERASYIDTLDKKSMRLKRLIEDLFEMSKANSDNIHLNLVEVDIVSLIKQVQLELDDKITESRVEFRNRFQSEKVMLNLDSEKTYRIFENLIINITKYSLPDTRAFIELTENESNVFISLKNVSATELDFTPEEITERFVRGDKSRNTEGSGLGLAIVRSFVDLQGGKMDIQLDGDLFKVNIKFKKVEKISS
ncbi:MAG: two-component sensor histidine kinase [Anaerocolumna sp.]|nr:two-component sensor histidine kinase [Anaerocolumna sp.]